MKQTIIVLGLFFSLLLGVLLSSFTNKELIEYDFQQLTTIESVVPAGGGRSRMIATSPSGTLEETEMKNFFLSAESTLATSEQMTKQQQTK